MKDTVYLSVTRDELELLVDYAAESVKVSITTLEVAKTEDEKASVRAQLKKKLQRLERLLRELSEFDEFFKQQQSAG